MKKTTLGKEVDSTFRISSFYAAAFLFVKGLELINIERGTPTRSQFVFRDSPQRESLVQTFNFAPDGSPEAMVDVRKFVMAIKMLKDKLYQDRF